MKKEVVTEDTDIDIVEDVDMEAPLDVLDYEDPFLRRTSGKVNFLDDETKKVIHDMAKTMLVQKGIGLAAPQVGLNKRFFLFISNPDSIEEGEDFEIKVAINPQIISREGEAIEYEGCLSYPEHVAYVKRAISIKVRYQDINGAKIEDDLSGLEARVFQHELDHLDGILFIDRMEPDTLKHVDELKDEEEEDDSENKASEEIPDQPSGGV